MKKLFLSVVALMCATLMFAQDNTTTVDQRGSENDSDVIQEGEWNTATVKQRQTLNVSDIITKGDYNMADVDQKGDTNFAKIRQGVGNAENNLAETEQDGAFNKSIQRQLSNLMHDAI